MAVKWAVVDGNWNSEATWNDGTLPQVGDEVYCNGHAITLNVDVNIGSGTIKNDANADYNIVAGGKVTNTGLRLVIANFYQDAGPLIDYNSTSTSVLTINGNLNQSTNASGGYIIKSANGHLNVSIVGNVNLLTGNLIKSNAFSYAVFLKVVGNVFSNGNLIDIHGNTSTFEITGSTELKNTFSTSQSASLTINGKLILHDYQLDYLTNFVINGGIEYDNLNALTMLSVGNLIINNPSTFYAHDISTTRTNPFIIVSDADMNNHQQYPQEDEVKAGTEYVWGEKVGTYQQPPESVVLKGYRYDNDEKEGTLENQNVVGCVTPEDVRKDVPLVGMGVVGSLVVPSVDDVREGVVFDNGSVGTLIVQGGGERLIIADFSYYTNAQSDTYIVDLTDADKPKFASAEERVLIEMFPELDLENIHEKYFDDLFVKFLKYRLIVEYYRTAGINSTFTPSEPTTEIVNYQNVRNEVWLNTANTYLKAWGAKYPNSIKQQRIML